MDQNTKYQAHIDGLRAIAVLSVFFFHLDVKLFSGGFVGVDIFFVISGFLITRIIIKELESTQSFSFKKFYLRRVRRILPALLVVFICTFFFATLLLSPSLMKSFGSSLFAAIFSVSNILFWLEADYFDVSSNLKPLLHTWSLSIEEQFYLFWPVTLLLAYKLGFKRWIATFLVVLFLISLAGNMIFSDGYVYFISHYLPAIADLIKDGRSTIFYLLPFRVFEFACGAILVFISRTKSLGTASADTMVLIGLSLIAYAVFCFDETVIFPSYNALYPCIGTALIIVFGAKCRMSLLLGNKLIVWFGLISYSLYLVHWPVVVFWKYLKVNVPLSVLDQMFIVAVSIGLAYASYRWVEIPFRKPTSKPGLLRRPTVVVFSTIFIAAIGLSVSVNNGWPWRVKPMPGVDVGLVGAAFHKEYYGGSGFESYKVNRENEPLSIVLMGDSHGLHYAEGFKRVFAENNFNYLFAAGTSCLHLPDFTRALGDLNYDMLCPRSLKMALDSIDSSISKPLVVLSHSWLSQIAKADLLDENGQQMGVEISVQRVLQGIIELKELIGDSPLLVMGHVPTSIKNIFELSTRPNLNYFYGLTRQELEYSNAHNKYVQLNDALGNGLKDSDNIFFLDPFDVLCEEKQCRNYTDVGDLIYSDIGHLSKAGSEFVVGAFASEIFEMIKIGSTDGELSSKAVYLRLTTKGRASKSSESSNK